MKKHFVVPLPSLLPPPLPPASPQPPREAAAQVSEQRLRAIVEKLVGFGTRHTLSRRADPTRGIGAALRLDRGRVRPLFAGPAAAA